jgi:iron(III) transport system substrate-binding protein
VFLWNNALLPEAQRPRTFAQFVEQLQRSPNTFRRKVTSYPVHTTPFGYNANFAFVRKHGEQAWQWFEEVAKVTPRFEGSSGPMSEKVTTGEYVLGYFVSAITFWTRLNDPARARILGFDFMRDGQILAMRGIAVPKGAQNVNAAKLMLDFVISADGQRAFGRGGMTPARPDVTAGDGVRHTYSSIVQAVGGEANIILGNYDPALLTGYEAFTERWKRTFNIR